jgi:lipoate-protein ligase B
MVRPNWKIRPALAVKLTDKSPFKSYTLIRVEDPRITQLRDLCDQAVKLKAVAEQLVTELTDQLQRSIWTHDERSVPRDRRRKPRS